MMMILLLFLLKLHQVLAMLRCIEKVLARRYQIISIIASQGLAFIFLESFNPILGLVLLVVHSEQVRIRLLIFLLVF